MSASHSSNAADLPDWFLPRVAQLLGAPARTNDLTVRRLSGGANNRVYAVTLDRVEYFVKWFFAAPADRRNRLNAEWKFLQFAWRQGVRCVAEPIACDTTSRLGIFSFINGRRLAAHELDHSKVAAALDFLHELNQFRGSADAADLPQASEACFSITAHIECVHQRIEHLVNASKGGSPEHSAEDLGAVQDFVNGELLPTSIRVMKRIFETVLSRGRNPSRELPQTLRIVSPSDFGFHNALMNDRGELRFVDFEYAGWDDPAKTVCDFFAQVQIPVPTQYRTQFVAALTPIAGDELAWRAELLQPLYFVKWCCIVLNPLLNIGRERREFSMGGEVSLNDCMEKARRLLQEAQ